MATLEKRKKQKTKTPKSASNSQCQAAAYCEELGKQQSETLEVGNAASTCEATAQYVQSAEQMDQLEEEELAVLQQVEQRSPDGVSLLEEFSQLQIESTPATAPPAENCASANQPIAVQNILPQQVVQYPNLTPLRLIDSAASANTYQREQLHLPTKALAVHRLSPLTVEQLTEIYHCADLEQVKQFEQEFLINSLLDSYEQDPLYIALMEYYNLQSKLTVNCFDIEKYRQQAEQRQQHIWKVVPVSKTFSGSCADGVEVKETVTYKIMQVDGKNLESTRASLLRLYDLLCCIFTTNLIAAKTVKVKIDAMISNILNCPADSDADLILTDKVSLQKTLNNQMQEHLKTVRHSVTILFMFTRKLSPNATFDCELKMWIQKVIALHLLLAQKQDHWFLLCNILRCPNGVASWATPYIQVPLPIASYAVIAVGSKPNELPLSIDSAEINHCMAVLRILLMPIQKRNDFLKSYTQSQKEISDPVQEDRWILIDSDGEDAHTSSGDCVGLKESDMISLLNQVPFEKLFTSVLNIEKFLEDYIIDPDYISTNQMLKVLAFFTKLIEIFGDGMLIYNTERYKQLAKRLGRMVRHTLQYASDYQMLFLQNKLSKDAHACQRIDVELNMLLLKACYYIYCTRNLSTWQYFSSLPFKSLGTETTWQMFYYLSVGFPKKPPKQCEDYVEQLSLPDFWKKFNVSNADSSAEDLYYLLQAFFEIANERDVVKDWELIKAIGLHIFYIGFVNEPTRDVCYKTARDMLVNLTLFYEGLLSSLLVELKVRLNDMENSDYLFKSLPLENWKPTMDSFETLSHWLLHFDFKSQENRLARIIISCLNWSFDCDGRLFLPHNIHVRMACLVTEALNKHAPEDQFTTWCWSMLSILRLHFMDQNIEAIKQTLQNPGQCLVFVPELEQLDVIFQGVSEHRPLAIYAALLVTLHGHSIPVICQKGFQLMKLLLNDHRHSAVIRCIQLIVPLFFETPETLANCESFQDILNTLLNADKTYLKIAKDIIYANAVGPVLELLDNMIHHQITTYNEYGLSSPLNVINVWLTCLTAVPNWHNTNVVYLLDKILSVSYQFPDARLQAIEYFRNYFKHCDEWKGSSKISNFKTLFGGSQSRLPIYNARQPWLALVLLEIEFQTQDNTFWLEFLRQLSVVHGKVNLDAVLKKTTSIVKYTPFSPQMLVIFKYAQLMASMDVSHPVFTLVCQKFFELYLSRLPTQENEHSFQVVYGLSDKFYEHNLHLMKKIKNKLKEAETFHSNESANNASDEALSYFYRNCARIMKTYSLWLEEASINKQSIEQMSFPPQYNIEKLRELLIGNTQHWTEFMYLPAIRKQQKLQADDWARQIYRLKSTKHLRSPLPPKTTISPIERIKTHLRSYDNSVPPPKFVKPDIKSDTTLSQSTLKDLNNKLKTLNVTAKNFHHKTSELNALNCNYLDIVGKLYNMVPYENIVIKTCNSLMLNRTCKSPARIKTHLEQIQKNTAVDLNIERNRERHKQIIKEILNQNVEEFTKCLEEMSYIIRLLLDATKKSNEVDKTISISIGVKFYFELIENMTEITMKFVPTNEFYSQLLIDLGIFLQEDQEEQGMKILGLALQRPDLLKVLACNFVPGRTRPACFLKLYKFLIDSYLKRCDTKILFVLFSKFDMIAWLENFKPKLYDINQLLQLVLRGLECWSQPNSTLLQDQFERHLVHIFNYDFPQHYGEVLQLVLNRISDQKLMPTVLVNLLNSMLQRYDCRITTPLTTSEQIREIAVDFAHKQTLFNLKAATDTIMLFARHFQMERLQHGLHGLYPKHKDYCQPLSLWFTCFGHILTTAGICTYQELLADQISDIMFGSIIEMYAPWLITYTEQTMQQPTANWIRQLSENGNMLPPWSEQHMNTAKIMIKSFISTLSFILDNLPVSCKVLGHTFSWYMHHFAIQNVKPFIYSPIHNGIATLPWEKFKPEETHINMLHSSLQKHIPESHAMLGHIFIRINWNNWFAEFLPKIPVKLHTTVISQLFTIFIKIAFEPNIHIHTNTSRILEEAVNYPWHMVEYAELEQLLTWFVSKVEPAVVLKIPGEISYVDMAVMDLIRLSCGMMPEFHLANPISNVTAKRILYTRTVVRLLRVCAAKHYKLLSTKTGLWAFNTSFKQLLGTIQTTVVTSLSTQTLEMQKREVLNLLIEIIVPMQTQSEEVSNLHVDSIIEWQQEQKSISILISQTLVAVGHMKAFIAAIYKLLETTIAHYFDPSEEPNSWHSPSWRGLLQTMLLSLEKLDLMPIMQGPYLFVLNLFIVYKLSTFTNSGDKITFLQDLSQLVESAKISSQMEARLAIVWGTMICRGSQLLIENVNAKKPLLMLAKSLLLQAMQSESWSDGLLGAIGLKQDTTSNKRKVLSRCLACVVFGLFPVQRIPQVLPNQNFADTLHNLTMLLANKKYLDVKPLIVSAVGILKEHTFNDLQGVPLLVIKLIQLFYQENCLATISEVWDFEFRL